MEIFKIHPVGFDLLAIIFGLFAKDWRFFSYLKFEQNL
jgi:hypothetical protein